MKRLLPVLLLIFNVLILSCGGDQDLKYDEFSVHGKLKNSRGEKIFLQYLGVDSIHSIDSMRIDENGEFYFKSTLSESGFYVIRITRDNFITILPDKGEKIEIASDAKQLAFDYSVSGSKGSALIYELNYHTRRNVLKSDSLNNCLLAYQVHPKFDSVKREIDIAYNQIFEDQKAYIKSFIDQNPYSLVSIMAIYQVFGRMKVVSEKSDYEYYEKLDNSLNKVCPQNPYVIELHKRVELLRMEETERNVQEQKLDSGNVAPDFRLNSVTGYPVSLSSFRGRVVLLYFWAGSSFQSQVDIPHYKALNKKYGNKGFTIIGVSLDKDRQTWEDAIRSNKLSWIQVSDLREWDSPVVKLYNIISIPVCFLIDREGKIIAKRPDINKIYQLLYRCYKF